jgi:hypothetical protein
MQEEHEDSVRGLVRGNALASNRRVGRGIDVACGLTATAGALCLAIESQCLAWVSAGASSRPVVALFCFVEQKQ